MQLLRFSLLGFLALFLTPLALHAIWWLSHDTAVAWNRADCSCAFSDSTVRRFNPNTSGTYETLTCGVNRLYKKALLLGTGASAPGGSCWRLADRPAVTLG